MFPKKSDKRPESKHGRPESSKYQLAPRNDQESVESFHQQQQQAQPVHETIPTSMALQKFNKYVAFHNV